MNERYGNNAAELKHRLTFQSPPGASSGRGWPTQEWMDYATVWGAIKTQKGSRLFNADAVQMQGVKIFGIRYRKDLNDSMRIQYKGDTYSIESMTNDDENNQWYTILAKEVL